MPDDVVLVGSCPVPDCSEQGKPHHHIVSRTTLYEMFDPNGTDRIFYCHACGNMFAPTPTEKERIQQRLAQGTL
jgi:hypothetical protein